MVISDTSKSNVNVETFTLYFLMTWYNNLLQSANLSLSLVKVDAILPDYKV